MMEGSQANECIPLLNNAKTEAGIELEEHNSVLNSDEPVENVLVTIEPIIFDDEDDIELNHQERPQSDFEMEGDQNNISYEDYEPESKKTKKRDKRAKPCVIHPKNIQEQSIRLITLYSRNKMFWDPKHPFYLNKMKRDECWRRISLEMKLPVCELKKKMESLLGSYRREKSREKRSLITGSEDRLVFSAEVLARVEIVHISEEERLAEHATLLAARSHMPFRCEPCALGFVTERAYATHERAHEGGDEVMRCRVCLCRVRDKSALTQHRLRHYRRYRCRDCDARFRERDAAATHVMREHEREAFACEHCERVFRRPAHLTRHIEQHHTRSQQFECPQCGRVFYQKDALRCHMRTHDTSVPVRARVTPLRCETCERTFGSRPALLRHRLTHEELPAAGALDRVRCPLCRFACPDADALREHFVREHPLERAVNFVCSLCDRVCASRALLRNHMRRMHTDRTKKFQCDYCQRLYLTKGDLRTHISWSHMRRSALGPASPAGGGHACLEPGCDRVFRTPALLKVHTAREHRLEPPARVHVCHTCGKGFATGQTLTRHRRVHEDVKFPCKECGVAFKTPSYVKVHYQLRHLNMTRAQIREERARKAQPAKPLFVEVKRECQEEEEEEEEEEESSPQFTHVIIKQEVEP